VRACLTIDPANRPTSGELLQHPWLKMYEQPTTATAAGEDKGTDLLPNVKAGFDARKTCKCSFLTDGEGGQR
jgi:serine/threonine protein kinase